MNMWRIQIFSIVKNEEYICPYLINNENSMLQNVAGEDSKDLFQTCEENEDGLNHNLSSSS